MTKHFTTRLLTFLLALLVSAPAFAQRIADLDPRSSIAEDDNFYCVADDASYQGVCDLALLRTEIQERIHGANLQTGTTYELVLADAGKVVELANASPITLTIPANSSVAFPVNTVIQVVQGGPGAVTIGITSDTLNGVTALASQWDSVTLWKRASTEWVSTFGVVSAAGDADAIHDNVSGEIASVTEKTTIATGDLLLLEDSEASNAKKRATIANAVDARVVAVASGREEIWVPVQMMAPFAAGWAAPAAIANHNVTNFFSPIRYIAFDGSVLAETAYFNIAMPKRWNRGTITFRAYWRTSTTATGTVLWGLGGRAMSDDDASGAFSNVYVSDTANGTQYDLHISPESDPVTVQGSPAVEDLVTFVAIRDVNDTNTVDAWLEGYKIYWTSDAPTDD